VRKSVLNQHPAIAALMAPVAAKLTTPVVLALDADVELDNETVSTVAHDWLVQNGFLTS
jgi:osmoprotectant transport system substrate-binding protein